MIEKQIGQEGRGKNQTLEAEDQATEKEKESA